MLITWFQDFLGKLKYPIYIIFLYKNGNFWKYFKEHLIKIYTKTHKIAPFFKIFLEEFTHEPLCHAQHACSVATCINIYTSGKIICTPQLHPVMYAYLSLFGKK